MEHLVYVDSDNRDQGLWPNSNEYTLHLTTPILNIQEVELVSAQLPELAKSQFVTLDIAELRTPQHLTAASLDGTVIKTPSSNAFNGSFATIPIKITGTAEFYNANYRITTKYPARIDKLDRLTVTWRQPNTGSLLTAGRNMFLLKFTTVFVPDAPERPPSLPVPVPWDSGDQSRIMFIAFAAVLGLFIIISVRK
jgi:hypothetical protein